jgi:nucleotide-binding universal stress UspA family protein
VDTELQRPLGLIVRTPFQRENTLSHEWCEMNGNDIARWISPNVTLVATNLLEGQTFLLHAIRQARLSRSQLLLVHVMSRSSLDTEVLDTIPCPAISSSLRAVQVKLDEMVEEFQFEGTLCEPVILVGDPAKQISLIAKSRAVDRVILGSSYKPPLTRMFETSVAEKVMASIDIPVCVIGRRVSPVRAREGPLGRVLCATSFHSTSSQAVKFASSFAELNNAHLTLLHVFEMAGMREHEIEDARIAARIRLCASLPSVERLRGRHSYVVKQGDPASIILAETLSQDLVVLGSHQVQILPGLPNRIVRQVMSGAQCPVIVINFSPENSRSVEVQIAA